MQHITTAIVTLDGADGVAVATRDGHQLFECHPRHCGFRRELPPATVEALVAQARRDGLPYTPIS